MLSIVSTLKWNLRNYLELFSIQGVVPTSETYAKEAFARRGQAIYGKRVRPQVEAGNTGRVVAIDVETEEFEVADDPIAASDRLFARCPDAQPWLVRIGHRALHRFGVAHASGLT